MRVGTLGRQCGRASDNAHAFVHCCLHGGPQCDSRMELIVRQLVYMYTLEIDLCQVCTCERSQG